VPRPAHSRTVLNRVVAEVQHRGDALLLSPSDAHAAPSAVIPYAGWGGCCWPLRVLLAASAVRSLTLTCCKLEFSPGMVVGVVSRAPHRSLGRRSVKLRIITPPCGEPACTVATIACGAQQACYCAVPRRGKFVISSFSANEASPAVSATNIVTKSVVNSQPSCGCKGWCACTLQRRMPPAPTGFDSASWPPFLSLASARALAPASLALCFCPCVSRVVCRRRQRALRAFALIYRL
jgi:hypothetical protein